MVNKLALENFLVSVDESMPIKLHFANLSVDAKAYRWNIETVRAIRAGIAAIYTEGKASLVFGRN